MLEKLKGFAGHKKAKNVEDEIERSSVLSSEDLPENENEAQDAEAPFDIDRELAEHEAKKLKPQAVVDDDPDPPSIAFCNTQCGLRETCALRNTFVDFVTVHENASSRFPAHEQPTFAEALADHVEPFIDLLSESRDDCAQEKYAEHQVMLVEQARIAPVVKSLVGDSNNRLDGLETGLNEMRAEMGSIKHLLERLVEGQQSGARIPVQTAQPASIPVVEALQARATPTSNGGALQQVVRQGLLTDEQAWEAIRQARETYPDDDADAARHLFSSTTVTQGQASKVAKAHGLAGWSPGNLSTWKNNAQAKSQSSLNKDRTASTDEVDTEVET